MYNIREILLSMNEDDSFRRIPYEGTIPLYVGLDSKQRYSLFVILDNKPADMRSLRMLEIFTGIRKDKKYGITFSLINKTYLDMFIYFCEDIINSAKINYSTHSDANVIYSRYSKWKQAFSRECSENLSFEQIKGLIAELYFLEYKLIPKFGEELAIKSWCGIEATNQDFWLDNEWVEVKALSSGADSIKISSVEQLDIPISGYLVVIFLDKTSETDYQRISINDLINRILSSIEDIALKENINDKLFNYGYVYNELYDKYCFRLKGICAYRVNEKFPCLRADMIPTSVNKIKYELSIESIKNFKVGDLYG